MIPIKVRDVCVADAQFVRSTWLASYVRDKRGGRSARAQRAERHMLQMAKDAGALLKVAQLGDNADILLGWGAARKGSLYYVFVKEAWRQHGIAKQLIAHLGFTKYPIHCKNTTRYAKKIDKSHPNCLEFGNEQGATRTSTVTEQCGYSWPSLQQQNC